MKAPLAGGLLYTAPSAKLVEDFAQAAQQQHVCCQTCPHLCGGTL